MAVPAEAERRSERTVVEEVAEDVGLGRLAVAALDEAAVDQRLDDDVALAVERRGPNRPEREDQNQKRGAPNRASRRVTSRRVGQEASAGAPASTRPIHS